jgi:hypothetical protein
MQDQRKLVVSAKDATLIKSEVAAVAEIESSLKSLRTLAAGTDFEDPAQKDNFSMNVNQLTRFYERAERLALDVIDQKKN